MDRMSRFRVPRRMPKASTAPGQRDTQGSGRSGKSEGSGHVASELVALVEHHGKHRPEGAKPDRDGNPGRDLRAALAQAPRGYLWRMNRGIALGLSAYLLWGMFPLYFRLLRRIPALELVAHRVVWSAALLLVALAVLGRIPSFLRSVRSWRVWGVHLVTALLIGINWLLYVWGVNAGHVVECSLGYFLNPLVSVGLGVAVLRERLRPAQWAGVALAASGIVYLSFRMGTFPWLSVALALSFGLYGLFKKTAPLNSVNGLFAETLVLFLPALGWILLRESAQGPLHTARPLELILLVGTGIVTTVPMLLFAMATRRIPLSLVGLLQYLTPTMQFLLGVFFFREPFSAARLQGFALVWAGLAVVAMEGLWKSLHRQKSV